MLQEDIVMGAPGMREANVAVPTQVVPFHVEFGANFSSAGSFQVEQCSLCLFSAEKHKKEQKKSILRKQ
jgi:hypothetical protein